MTCMFCKMLNRKSINEKGYVWCNFKKDFVQLIAPKCGGFVPLVESEVKK